MPALTTDDCYANAAALKGRTVLITGAGSGFGRETALKFTEYGARVVLGDVDAPGLKETCRLLEAAGRPFVSGKCDVTSWDDQVALFELGFKKFGNIDIVLPNAGISEVGMFDHRLEDGDGGPTKPNLKTLDVDLIGVLYTARLALWYFDQDKRDDPGLRCICFTGSMSSFYGADYGVMYGASKAAILGIIKGLIYTCNDLNARAVAVYPYFTSGWEAARLTDAETGIIADGFEPDPKKGFCKIEDVVAAFVASITDPEHNYGAWLIPDERGVVRMETTGHLWVGYVRADISVGAEGARRPRAKL